SFTTIAARSSGESWLFIQGKLLPCACANTGLVNRVEIKSHRKRKAEHQTASCRRRGMDATSRINKIDIVAGLCKFPARLRTPPGNSELRSAGQVHWPGFTLKT